MAHTIRCCDICGGDYMHHNNDLIYSSYCQSCYEKDCLVIHDLQSEDSVSVVLEYDYIKHDLGNPIFFKGNRSECREWISKNTPINETVQDILSSVAIEVYSKWEGTPFQDTHIDNTVKNDEQKDEAFLQLSRAYWFANKLSFEIRSLQQLKKLNAPLDYKSHKEKLIIRLSEIESILESINF